MVNCLNPIQPANLLTVFNRYESQIGAITQEYKSLGEQMAPKWLNRYKVEVFLAKCDDEMEETIDQLELLKIDSLSQTSTSQLCMDSAGKLNRKVFELEAILHCLTSELLVYAPLAGFQSPIFQQPQSSSYGVSSYSPFGMNSSSYVSRESQHSNGSLVPTSLHFKLDKSALERQIICSQRNLVNNDIERTEHNKYLEDLMLPVRKHVGPNVYQFYSLANEAFGKYVKKLNEVSSDDFVGSVVLKRVLISDLF